MVLFVFRNPICHLGMVTVSRAERGSVSWGKRMSTSLTITPRSPWEKWPRRFPDARSPSVGEPEEEEETVLCTVFIRSRPLNMDCLSACGEAGAKTWHGRANHWLVNAGHCVCGGEG